MSYKPQNLVCKKWILFSSDYYFKTNNLKGHPIVHWIGTVTSIKFMFNTSVTVFLYKMSLYVVLHSNDSPCAISAIQIIKYTGIILCMRPANERWHHIWLYNVTSSFIGWVHTQNYPLVHTKNYAWGSFGVCHFSWFCDGLDIATFIPNCLGCITGTGAITWLPQCQWSNPELHG